MGCRRACLRAYFSSYSDPHVWRALSLSNLVQVIVQPRYQVMVLQLYLEIHFRRPDRQERGRRREEEKQGEEEEGRKLVWEFCDEKH